MTCSLPLRNLVIKNVYMELSGGLPNTSLDGLDLAWASTPLLFFVIVNLIL
jgi:hypothetical protein